jgi:hypothetical protein
VNNTMDDELESLLNYVPSTGDPLSRWRREAEQFAEEARQGREAVREEERRMRETPEAWTAWFIGQLRQHLRDQLQPHLDGLAEGACELIGEQARKIAACEQRLAEQRDEISELRLECARLAIKVAEARTDAVLNAMPGLNASRGAVN